MATWGGAARADVCSVDLALETADEDTHFEVFFGEVVDDDSEQGAVAVCLAWRSDPLDDASEPVLVAWVQGGKSGTCTTVAEDRSCSGGGCDEIEVVTDRSRNVTIGSGRDGVICRNDETSLPGDYVTIGAAPFGWQLTVVNDENDNSQGFLDSTTYCTYNMGDNNIYYGKGYMIIGGRPWYTGSMLVCAGDDIVCTIDDDDLDLSSDVVHISDNPYYLYSNIIWNPTSPTYECDSDDPIYVEDWASWWLASMYIHGWGGYDIIGGSPNDDRLYGDYDDTQYDPDGDLIYGFDGDDWIYGYGGNDGLNGGDGFDILIGGVGNDQLYGGDDDDYLDGGSGLDYLNGNAGDDDYCNANTGTTGCPSSDCCEVPDCELHYNCATQ
jgi:hypothetical protein